MVMRQQNATGARDEQPEIIGDGGPGLLNAMHLAAHGLATECDRKTA
jgi:hypothetical protein